jgi:hypothetical protein
LAKHPDPRKKRRTNLAPAEPPLDSDNPMKDPFTEQVTHPAGKGQGANRAQPPKSAPGENDEDVWPVEEGFGLIP